MKKIAAGLLTLVMITNASVMVGRADEGITVTLNGNKIEFDVQPQLINERTMVPLRKIFEAMGANVNWYGETQTIIATKNNMTVTAKINDVNLYVGNEVKVLDVPPMIINDRTLVPARFVAEAFGANVEWDGTTQTVIITSKQDEDMKTPYYSKFNSIPDLGAIAGVKGTEIKADENGALYEYDKASVDENGGLTLYVKTMESLGFDVKVGSENIMSFEKNGIYVDITNLLGKYSVGITLCENKMDSSVQMTDIKEYSYSGITYSVPKAWGNPISKSGNVYLYPGDGLFVIQHQDGIDGQLNDKSMKAILDGIAKSVTNYNLISMDKINLPNISTGYYAEYTGIITNQNVRMRIAVIQRERELFILSYSDLKGGNTCQILNSIIESVKFENTIASNDLNEITDEYDFSSTTGIESYLYENYEKLNTDVGEYTFSYDILDFSRDSSDFLIYVEAEGPDLGLLFEYGTVILDDYNDSEIENAQEQLKNHMKTIAMDLIKKMPNKKITGSYHESHYRYPNLKMNLIVENYCTWANYDRGGKNEDGEASTFRWLRNLDGRNEYK